MKMTPDKLREISEKLGVSNAELAEWGSLQERAIRRYLVDRAASSARDVPPFLPVLMTFLDMRPEMLPIVRQIVADHSPPYENKKGK